MLSHFLISISIALLLQSPVRPIDAGTITGIVKTTDGKPAIGVRVTARAKPDSLDQLQEGIAMSSIAQTDEKGRYLLANVPPGRYYITAGNIDLPTYYPGTLDVASGTAVQITPGAERGGIDFTLADLSFSLAGLSGVRPDYTIPVQVQVEGGSKLPIFSPNGLAMLDARVPGFIDGARVALNSSSISLPFPSTPKDYAVSVFNVPEGYSVKSMTYGSVNLLSERLHLAAASVTLSAASSTLLSIVLAPSSTPVAAGGVRITGQAVAGTRSVWLGDRPGFLYADGTFELRGVASGAHIILASNENAAAMQPSGASIVVGDRDIDGLQLDAMSLLPREFATARPASHPAGTKIPLATLKGRLVSARTQQPVRGMVNIFGRTTQVAYAVDPEGRFEVPKLLPGSYTLTASIVDYYTVDETVVVGEEDAIVELRARPAF